VQAKEASMATPGFVDTFQEVKGLNERKGPCYSMAVAKEFDLAPLQMFKTSQSENA